MSFQFQPSDLADSTLVSIPSPQEEEKTAVDGWWLLPFLASGALFWIWFVPAMAGVLN